MVFRSTSPRLSPATVSLTMLLLIVTLTTPTVLSQAPAATLPVPTMSGCAPTLLSLAPCMPFVQGSGSGQSLPTQLCCGNLDTLYKQEPGCLCLILNHTDLSSFPINTTMAMELPALCNLTANINDCPGVSRPVIPSTASPQPQISLGSYSNHSSNASSPMVQVSPRSSMSGFGFPRRSAGAKLKAEWYWAISAVIAAFISSKELI
ncbi:hypothetical protein ACFE04_006719 [Oxalis oulophora]